MRLWHIALIPKLPRAQLLSQHRECCALRGLGWGRKHSTVDYVFQYRPWALFKYHKVVMREMQSRGYRVEELWMSPNYRGKRLGYAEYDTEGLQYLDGRMYPEHNDEYLRECLENLRNKGIVLEEAI